MKYRKHLIITLLLCSVIIFWTGCQKDDIYDNATKADVDADTFFHYGERDMLVADIIDFLREKNDSSEFITVFSQQYGNPEWQKAVISENDTHVLLFVPVIKRSLRNVETIWVFKISDNNYIEYYPVSKNKVVQNDMWTFDYFTQEVYDLTSVNGVRYVSGDKVLSKRGWIIITFCVQSFAGFEYEGNAYWTSTGWHYWTTTVFVDDFDPYGQHGGDSGIGGGSFYGGGGGGGNPPPTGSELNSNLKKLFKGENNLSNEDTDRLNEAYEDMRENCFYETIDNYLMQNGVQLNNINMNPNYGGQAGINNHGDLTFWNSENINSENLSHEWIHLFQKKYHNMTLFGDNIGMMEFEVALIQDILMFIEVGGNIKKALYSWACFAMGKDEYQEAYIAWLKTMTNNGTSYPSTIDINKFLFFSNVFGDVSISYNKNKGYIYGNAAYGSSAIQEIFNLANQNCNK